MAAMFTLLPAVTTTTTGLKVTAHLDTTVYPTGVKIAKHELAQLSIRNKRVLPRLRAAHLLPCKAWKPYASFRKRWI